MQRTFVLIAIIKIKFEPNSSCFSTQNHPLTEDFNIARFSIDQISLLVKKNGIDQTNRLTLEDRKDWRARERKREKRRLQVVSRKFKLLYHQNLCQLHITWKKFSTSS